VQMFHMRQRWGAAVWRAQTQVFLGRLKYALPGWEEAESRRAAGTATEASWRSHASGPGDGGGLGGDSSWGAGYGGDVGRVDRQKAVERLGERRRLRAWAGPARGRPVVFWGARCAAWPVVKAPPKKKQKKKLSPRLLQDRDETSLLEVRSI
jgi:hypothetical protein